VAKKRLHFMQCKQKTRGQVNYMSPEDNGFLELMKKNSQPKRVEKSKVKSGKKIVRKGKE